MLRPAFGSASKALRDGEPWPGIQQRGPGYFMMRMDRPSGGVR
jgi:hypothetical protein